MLVFLALVSWGAATVGTSPRPAKASADSPVPILDQWTETTQVYQNPGDGTMTASIGAAPIQVADPSSPTGWAGIDTTLQSTPDGVVPERTEASIQFSSGDPGDPLATLAQDGASLSMGWTGDVPAPTVDGDTAIYSQVLPGVDATLQARPSGFEQSFVVASASDAPEVLDLPLDLTGMSTTLTDGGMLVLTDTAGAVVGTADPARMWGAATDPETGEPTVQALVPTSLQTTESGPVLELRPDPEFFTDPAVTYPVIIDPAVNLSLGVDTYVSSQTPTTGFPADTVLKSGLSGGGVYRTLLSFTDDPIIWSTVQSASLDLWENWSASCAATPVDLWSVAASFDATVSWGTQPAVGSRYASLTVAKGFSGACPAGTITLSSGGDAGTSLTTLVQSWANDEYAFPAVEIRARDETASDQFKKFNSSEAASHPPVLHVTYDHTPDPPLGLSATGTNPVTLHGLFSDADGGTGSVKYTVFNTSGAQVYSGFGSIVASGSDSPLTLPAGTLQNGYTWKAQAFDATLYSAYGTDQLYPAPGLGGAPPWNVIMIMTDDLDVGTLDVAAHQDLCPSGPSCGVMMPNYVKYFESAADGGIRFSNSFVSYSLCCPSRASFFTGRYAHNTGVKNNSGAYGGCTAFVQGANPPEAETIAKWLRDRVAFPHYTTGLIGKYLNGYGATNVPDNCKGWHVPPGWNFWDALMYHGATNDASNQFNYWLDQNGTKIYRDPGEGNGGIYQTDKLATDASFFISKAADPFFLYVAPSAPHLDRNATYLGDCAYPSTPPHENYPWGSLPTIRDGPYDGLGNNLSFSAFQPTSYNERTDDKPTVLAKLSPPVEDDPVNSLCVDKLWRDRLESLRGIDNLIGTIVTALNTYHGGLSNTVLIFTSDNGYFNGEHRLHQKIAPYEEGIRVPLSIRYPLTNPVWPAGTILPDFALNNDLAPTIADLGGAPIPAPSSTYGIDGQSLYARLTTSGTSWLRKRFLVEHYKVDQCCVPDASDGADFYPRFIGIRSAPTDATATMNRLYMKYDYNPDAQDGWDEFELYDNLNSWPSGEDQNTDDCLPTGLVSCPLSPSDPLYPLEQFLSALSSCSSVAAYTCQALENGASYPP